MISNLRSVYFSAALAAPLLFNAAAHAEHIATCVSAEQTRAGMLFSTTGNHTRKINHTLKLSQGNPGDFKTFEDSWEDDEYIFYSLQIMDVEKAKKALQNFCDYGALVSHHDLSDEEEFGKDTEIGECRGYDRWAYFHHDPRNGFYFLETQVGNNPILEQGKSQGVLHTEEEASDFIKNHCEPLLG